MAVIDEHEKKLRELFREEATEHFEALDRSLDAGKADAADHVTHLKSALRAAHSLKGAATITGLLTLQKMVHNFESCVSAIVAKKMPFGDLELDLLYRWLDAAHDEMDISCGTISERRQDPGELAAELEAHFGQALQLKKVVFETDAAALAIDAASASTMRVSTDKIDRQMANVDELLRLKSGGEARLAQLARIADMVERWRGMLAETRRHTRRHKGDTARAFDPLRVAALLEEQHALAERVTQALGAVYGESRDSTHALSTLTDTLHSDIRAVRMLPVEDALAPFGRMVRDLGRAMDKRVALEIAGGDTEVDRDVLEAIKDPVMHILRNAVDHGIESRQEREALAKPVEARLRVQARSRGGALELEVSDDGRGISAEGVAALAVERGLVSREELFQLDESAIRELVFHEGFSTKSEISDLSGRGVGLSVVRSAAEKLGGRVALETSEGRGSCFKLTLPLNLATSRLLLVLLGEELFAFPATAVERVIRVAPSAISRVDQGHAFELEGKPVPVFRLDDCLGLPPATTPRDRLVGVVLSTLSRRAAFIVDRVLDEQELVARGLGDHLHSVRNISGATVLADGRVAPILNPGDLLAGAVAGGTIDFGNTAQKQARKVPRVLVVDDSVTTRTLEKSILEAAGYTVEVATDGAEALARLSRVSFDLVLSDVQMPRVDGLALVRAIKQDQRLKAIPVVLVSSLDAPEQQRQGLDAGADAYLSKGEFEQGLLLSTLARFI